MILNICLKFKRTVSFQGNFAELHDQHLQAPPPPLRTKNLAIPFAVEQVVLKALAKEPKERFASVQEFAVALAEASKIPEEVPLSPLPPPIEENPSDDEKGKRTLPAKPVGQNQEGPTILPENHRKQHRTRIASIALSVLILLLILSSGIIYGGFSWKRNFDNSNATAMARANVVTNTALATHAHLTATANIEATTRAVIGHNATATAFVNVSQYPFSYTSQQFQLRDVFPDLFKLHANNDNWDDNDQCRLTNLGYLINDFSTNQTTTCFAANTKYDAIANCV